MYYDLRCSIVSTYQIKWVVRFCSIFKIFYLFSSKCSRLVMFGIYTQGTWTLCLLLYIRVYTQYLCRFHLVQIIYCFWNCRRNICRKYVTVTFIYRLCTTVLLNWTYWIHYDLQYHQKNPKNKYHASLILSFASGLAKTSSGCARGSRSRIECVTTQPWCLGRGDHTRRKTLKVKDRGLQI